MTSGAFKSFKHDHIFDQTNYGVLMTDVFDYKSPLGILGKIADALFFREVYESTFNREKPYNKTVCRKC